jgi:2'-5' RNA ligase
VRLFVALDISREIREPIAKLIRELKPLDDSWKWTSAKNLHVTLKFLGETPVEKLETVKESLRGVSSEFPILLKFKSLGFFPNERRPRVVWVGLEAPTSLGKLAHSIDESLGNIGVPREDREFSPHLTLARNRKGALSPHLRDAIAHHSGQFFGEMTATSFHLIESRLKSTGAEYTTLESYSGSQKS